ncbi:hypothetical protein [Parasphingorhabdus sp.]|uniref:hypothetical protein n=1 Tax=Parasphingorhabdus sp. TaxID=2709688 RepID=UPI0032F042F0
MAKSSHYKGNNEGGYGNPPVKDQFDGTPGPGRPKGSKSLDGALRKVFRKKVARIDKNGKRTLIEAPEALAERLLELGLKGPLAANIEARAMAEKFGPTDEQLSYDITVLTDVELNLYGYLLYRLTNVDPEEPLEPSLVRILEQIGRIVEVEDQLRREEHLESLRKPRPRPQAVKRYPLDEYFDEDEDDDDSE